MTSAYPSPVATLIPQAQELAAELGTLPSRNALMTRFRIGARKATEIRALLAGIGHSPAGGIDTPPDVDRTGTDGDETRRELAPVTEAPRAVPSPDDAEVTEPRRRGSVTQDGGRGAFVAEEPTDDPVALPPAPAVSDRVGWSWAARMPRSWPLLLLALPAFVAIWSGWVGLGELTGFGLVHPLPGIADGFTLNTAITLPIGVETYAAYALRVALASGDASKLAKRFAGWSAVASLALGFLGQVAYHLMTVRHITSAPWWITTVVSGLPVVVLGCGAALAHLQRHTTPTGPTTPTATEQEVSR